MWAGLESSHKAGEAGAAEYGKTALITACYNAISRALARFWLPRGDFARPPLLFFGLKAVNEASINGIKGVFHESEGLWNNVFTLDA